MLSRRCVDTARTVAKGGMLSERFEGLRRAPELRREEPVHLGQLLAASAFLARGSAANLLTSADTIALSARAHLRAGWHHANGLLDSGR